MEHDRGGRALIALGENRAVAPAAQAFFPEPPAEEVAIPLSHYFWILKRHRWRILLFVAVAVLITTGVSLRLTPIYEATATIDIDRQTPPGVIGQDSTRSAINDTDQFLATQIRLVQSDSVLRPVARKYNLQDHERQWDSARRPPPADADQAPVILRQLRVSRPPNTYLLHVGYRSPDSRLAADVANAIAQSYIEHTYNIRLRSSASLASFMEKQLEELKSKMESSGLRLSQFERELNVINPEEKTSILSARLLQLNTEYTNAQADRMRKQTAFESTREGSIEAAQVSTQGEALKRLVERSGELREKFAEIQAHYGANHPEYRKVSAQLAEVDRQLERMKTNIGQRVNIEYHEAMNREQMLRRAVNETKAEFDRLNARSFEYQSLKREAEADKKLYEELIRKIKEAGINAGFQNSAVRVADYARPALDPVFPNLKLNCLLALVLSSFLAVGVALISDVLDNTVRNNEQVVRMLRTEVIGNLPLMRRGRLALLAGTDTTRNPGALIRSEESGDQSSVGFYESIRTLRSSILLADFDRRVRSLLVTSASPGEGKTITACHLAAAHAEQQFKTLLIDGDLRRPSVHKRFGLSLTFGFSSVLDEDLPWKQVLVKPEGLPDLDVLPAGPPSRRASDRIAQTLVDMLEEASREYDLVIVDAPPLLGFSESLQMSTLVDGVVIVAKAGETNRKSLASVISTLHRLRANILGLVLNGVHKELSDTYAYYSHYGKYYSARKEKS